MELRRRLDEYLRGTEPGDGLREALRAMMLKDPRGVPRPDFPPQRPDVLQFMAQLYDQAYFGGALSDALAQACDQPWGVAISPRMTRRSARTGRARRGGSRAGYLLTLSSLLFVDGLFPGPRGTRLFGRYCEDRLDLLQRVLEHHLLHVAEELAYGKTRCGQERFQRLAFGIFGHTEFDEGLPSFADNAEEAFGLRVGDRVSFELEELPYEGVLERIGKRATVQVEHEEGEEHPDGKRYLKARVPLRLLRRRSGGEG